MWRILLVLLQLMEIVVASSYSYADLFPCSNNETRKGVLHFAENTDFELCCQLHDSYCNKTTFNDTLTLLPENANSSQLMNRIDPCLVILEFKNASSENEGYYECIWNAEPLASDKVYIIKKPPQPVINSFSCTQNNVVTVTFDRGVPNTAYSDSYLVTMIEPKKTVTLCNNSYPMCKSNDRICTCIYSDAPDPWPVGHNEVIIIVNVSRSVESSETRKNYSIAANIRPGPVKRLKVTDVSPYDANIQFCMHKDTERLFGFMQDAGAPLQFHLWIFTKQGIPEILNVTLPSIEPAEASCSYCSDNKCMRVHLSNLTAFTNYTVIAFDSGGGGESQKRKMEFTTNQTEPAQPPEVDHFSFIRWDNVTVNGNLVSGLVLMWKPLLHAAIGGGNLSYYVEVTSKKDFSVNQTTQETYVFFNMDLPTGPLTAKIWSQNVIGQSSSFALLDIPPKSDSRVPYVTVELNRDKALVYVNLTHLKSDMPLTIQWCSKYDKKTYMCQEYPYTANYTISAGVTEPQNFEIQINPSNDEKREMMDYRIIEYYHLKALDSSPSDVCLADASVITYPDGIPAIEDYDFYTDDFKYDSDDYYYDFEIRRKRYVENSKWNLLMNDEIQRRKLLEYQTSQAGDDFPQMTPLVFISFKMEDGLWNTGMIPASCYYDRLKGDVSLVVSQRVDDGDKAIILQWVQVCDKTTPAQFLADFFKVYSSECEFCSEDEADFIGKARNSMFQPNILKLTKPINFARIKACTDDGQCQFAKPYAVQTLEGVKSQDNTIIIAVVVSVVAGSIVIMMVVIGFFCLCKKRRKNAKELASKPIIRPPTFLKAYSRDLLNQDKGSIPPEVPGRTMSEIANVSNNSTDSGRGTDLYNGDSKNLKNMDCDISPGILSDVAFKNGDTSVIIWTEMGGITGDSHESGDCDDTGDESKDDTEKSEDSDSDMEQRWELAEKGLSFNNENISSSSQSCDTSRASQSTNESEAVMNCSQAVSESDISTSSEVKSMYNGHFLDQNILLRMSSSESDGDSERPLITNKNK